MDPSLSDTELDWSLLSHSSDKTSVHTAQNPYQLPININHNDQNCHVQPRNPRPKTFYEWFKPLVNHANVTQFTNNCHSTTQQVPSNNNKINHASWLHHTQRTVNPNQTNKHWGDNITMMDCMFHVMSHNVNSLSIDNNFVKGQGIAAAIQLYQINALCLQETSINWTNALQIQVCKVIQQSHKWTLISTLSSNKPSGSKHHQLGGTAVIVTGSHTVLILSQGQDPSGMGQWSYVELLGKNQCKIIIASVYCICPQMATIGSHTIYTQQYHILLWKGVSQPEPCHQTLVDLVSQVQEWTESDQEVLICMDLNESTSDTNPDQGIGYLLSHMSLLDLHKHQHPNWPTPATHIHGLSTINVCLGTTQFAEALIGAWYLSFGFLATVPSNHCTLGIDFDLDMLFGNKIPEAEQSNQWGIYSNDMPTVWCFNDMVAEACQEVQLFDTVNMLYCKYWFNVDDHELLEKMDQELTKNTFIHGGQHSTMRTLCTSTGQSD